MSDEFFRKAFGDAEPVHVGSGWISGVSAVFLGLLALGGTLCLRFPEILTLPDARAKYPMEIMRLLIQGAIFVAFVFGSIDIEITGSGKDGGSRRMSKSSSQSVSPVITSFTPTRAQMSPE